MKKFSLAVWLALFPILALADSSLSFAPPASDFSVIFLGNLFGIVDGVLHGSGSQIMGSMFAVFNASVLALGGMIIMYTLIVSTMNTAHQGEMLGKQWSSIWIPIRSTIGLALLIPKASGYCMMQIFAMWLVVQGVGAADKVWDAALSYLNKGGSIIQVQMNPTDSLFAGGSTAPITMGAQNILAGQVCMIGLQNQLQAIRQDYLAQKGSQNPAGPCVGNLSGLMSDFCGNAVPNFIASINVVDIQRKSPTQTTPYSVPMPNVDIKPYSGLNGVCGQIVWNPYSVTDLDAAAKVGSFNQSDKDTAALSRPIAIQQMYMDLYSIAQIMVGNDPTLGSTPSSSSANTDFSSQAVQQFGVPWQSTGAICFDSNTPNCTVWGQATSSTSSPLFNGTEFQGAIQDYNSVMLPTITLVNQAKSPDVTTQARVFIQKSEAQGWIMAGSYFFNLITLNTEASADANLTDVGSGLDGTKFDPSGLMSPFTTAGKCTDPYAVLCTLFNQDKSKVLPIYQLISNAGAVQPAKFGQALGPVRNVVDGPNSATVYGYTTNSSILQLPNQPGQEPLQFATNITVPFSTEEMTMPDINFGCGGFMCIGGHIGDIMYNYIFKNIFQAFLNIIIVVVNGLMKVFLVYPLYGMAAIFKQGLMMISASGVNPVVALAQMGVFYINFASNLWIQLLSLSITTSLIPLFGVVIFACLTFFMPLLLAWLGIMVGIGMTTAYYVPILPYMIFTFGSIGWFMAVIETMVAAPIVALGITHPEGHEAFGKAEQSVMILLNVFLRPSMMIIGYIAAISLSYVSVWVINAGFDNAIGFIQDGDGSETGGTSWGSNLNGGSGSGGYTSWAGTFAFFFSILMYTMMYLTVVTKAFTLISVLPDKVLRWIGGSPESYGGDTAQWGEEVKKKVDDAGKETQNAQNKMGQQAAAGITEGIDKVKSLAGGKGEDASAQGKSSPPPGGAGGG